MYGFDGGMNNAFHGGPGGSYPQGGAYPHDPSVHGNDPNMNGNLNGQSAIIPKGIKERLNLGI